MYYFSLGSLMDVTAEEVSGEISLKKDVCKIHERKGNGSTWFKKETATQICFYIKLVDMRLQIS